MSGWEITLWFAEVFVGAGLIGYGLHLRDRHSAGWLVVALGLIMEIAFVIFGPEM